MEFHKDKYDTFLEEKNKLEANIIEKNKELKIIISQIEELKKVIIKPNIITKYLSKKYKKQKEEIDKLIANKEKLENEIELIDTKIRELYKTIGNIPDYVLEREKLRQEPVIEDGILVIDGTTPLSDKTINVDFNDNLSIDDIVLVHTTNNFPQNGVIRCAKEKMLTMHGISFPQHRLTTHFSLNGRVGDHTTNIWSGMGIVIIDPINKHIDEVGNLIPVDTFVRGNFKLSDKAVIMVNENIINTLPKELFNQYTIVKFTGDSITATNKMLLMMGYKPQIVNKDTWSNIHNQEKFENFVKEQYPEKSANIHISSLESNVERMLQYRDYLYAKYKGLTEFNGSEGIDNIPLDEFIGFWLYVCMDLTNKETLKEAITDFDFNEFYNMCINYGIVPNDNSVSFLGTESTLELQKQAVKNHNNIEKYYYLYLNMLGIEPLNFDEYINSFEELLKSNVPEGTNIDKKEAFHYYAANYYELPNRVILYNGEYYKITERYIKELSDIYKKYGLIIQNDSLNKDMTNELYDLIQNKSKGR